MDFDIDQQFKELRKTISIMELMCNSIDESIVLLNEKNEITWCNSLFDRLVEQSHISILGKPIFDLFDIKKIVQLNKENVSFLNLNLTESKWIVEDFSYKKETKEYFLEVAITRCQENADVMYVVIIRDVTMQKKLYKQLEHLAHYDLLTNLPNRLQLKAHFKRELARAKRHNRRLAVFFIDIDRFKEVNDTYGHAAGDSFLKIVSERLQATLRDEDFVARYSGDEFVVIISEFDDKSVAEKIAEKISQSLCSPYSVFGNIIKNSASLGISFYPSDGESAAELIDTADKRMYDEKNKKSAPSKSS